MLSHWFMSIALILAVATEILINGDFEQYHTGWTEITSVSVPIIQPAPSGITTHSGRYLAWLGGYNNADDQLYQNVTFPADLNSAILSFWYWSQSQETAAGRDYFMLQLIDPNTGHHYVEAFYIESLPPTNAWRLASFTLTSDQINAIRGQTVRVRFRVVTNGSLLTSFFIDDVSLQINGPVVLTPTPTPTPTQHGPTPTPTPPLNPPSQGGLQLPLMMNRLVATPTDTPTPTPLPPTSLYPHADYTLQRTVQTTESDIPIRPAWPSREWTYTLNGDITGNQYHMTLKFYSIVYPGSYLAELILDQNGVRTTLASATVVVWSTGYLNKTVSGLDPAATAGDHLILRISHGDGAWGGTLIGGNTDARITIPGNG